MMSTLAMLHVITRSDTITLPRIVAFALLTRNDGLARPSGAHNDIEEGYPETEIIQAAWELSGCLIKFSAGIPS